MSPKIPAGLAAMMASRGGAPSNAPAPGDDPEGPGDQDTPMEVTFDEDTIRQNGLDPAKMQVGMSAQITATGTVVDVSNGVEVKLSNVQIQPGQGQNQSDPDKEFSDAFDEQGPPQS